ncbi:unnamed protein product [Trifolium pratense]|uniref:Uncharacterized protein n=1 Tax=Trifolium pratense TaxID=57577 RepID=A0ACB0MD07_TRIPR|nr:unnamed protein product [Trifolium pratense]
MAANVTTTATLSLSFAAKTSSSLLATSSSNSSFSKRFISFSVLPYPSFSLRTSNPRAVFNEQTPIVQQQPNDVVSVPEEQPLKLRNTTELYVSNLPRTYDTQHLLNMFTPHGTVLSAQVCRNVETGESKGSAYVKMGSYNAAKNAAAALDGLDVEGRQMHVKFSVQMNIKKNFVETLNATPLRTIFYERPRKAYVGNLAKSATPEDLRHLFGKAAEMEVVAVPSLPKQSHLYTAADEVINSLLDLQLEKWGLPPFADWVERTLPVDPWYIGGPVIKGFGRGSKVLGIPTANLSTKECSDLLAQYPSGVYFGWAGLSTRGIFKMVMSIGWNPYFSNKEKTIEPWLLHEFTEDFYGEELRLVMVGYIRPEVLIPIIFLHRARLVLHLLSFCKIGHCALQFNFPSLESLIAKIHEDRRIAERALDLPLYSSYKNLYNYTNSPQL